MIQYIKTILISSTLLGTCLLSGCATQAPKSFSDSSLASSISSQTQAPASVDTSNSKMPDSLYALALLHEQQKAWHGTPYRLGGHSRKGVDCSWFVMHTYSNLFHIKLPRVTVNQVKQGIYVPKKNIQTGDLVFFKTGRGPNGYHVGIYVKDDLFLHVSSRKGVKYSSLNSSYWRRAYWQARRL